MSGAHKLTWAFCAFVGLMLLVLFWCEQAVNAIVVVVLLCLVDVNSGLSWCGVLSACGPASCTNARES